MAPTAPKRWIRYSVISVVHRLFPRSIIVFGFDKVEIIMPDCISQEAKLTPWLWAGETKDVWDKEPGRCGRFAATAEQGTHRPSRTENEDVLFRVPQIRCFRTRYKEMFTIMAHSYSEITGKILIFQQKSLDIIGGITIKIIYII